MFTYKINKFIYSYVDRNDNNVYFNLIKMNFFTNYWINKKFQLNFTKSDLEGTI